MTDVTPVQIFARPMPTGGGLRNQVPDLAGEIRQEIQDKFGLSWHLMAEDQHAAVKAVLDVAVAEAVRRVTEAHDQGAKDVERIIDQEEQIASLREELNQRDRAYRVRDLTAATLQARIDKALAVCAEGERQATRWEQPFPVPAWVTDVRAALSGEADPAAEVQIETREWVMLGEHIIDDPEEYRLATFVQHDDLPEIITAYLAANNITPPLSGVPETPEPEDDHSAERAAHADNFDYEEFGR